MTGRIRRQKYMDVLVDAVAFPVLAWTQQVANRNVNLEKLAW
jgi:hypothetical protein